MMINVIWLIILNNYHTDIIKLKNQNNQLLNKLLNKLLNNLKLLNKLKSHIYKRILRILNIDYIRNKMI